MSLHGYDLPRGKVECDWPHDAELQNAYKRIAELEAELAVSKGVLGARNVEVVNLKAEVERLRHLGGAPPGVLPSPPHESYCSHNRLVDPGGCPDCNGD